MNKLLYANFYKLKKSKIFWILLIFTIGFACYMCGSQYLEMIKYDADIVVDKLLLNFIPFTGVIIAVFTSLFIGNEYSDGTIRNKILIGHNRSKIYLSNLITNIIVIIVAEILFTIIVAIIGIPLFGGLHQPFSRFILLFINELMIIVTYSSIFTFISMICHSRTICAISNLLLALIMLIASLNLLDVLEQPEYILAGQITNYETNEMEFIKEKNPRFPSDNERKISKTILDLTPSGQSLEIVSGIDTNLFILPLYSLGIIFIFTSSGLILFRKKQLK